MSVDLIKYAYVTGELSPTLFGRTDLDKYDLGLAQAYNVFIDYRGGVSTRPGQEFCDFVKRDDLDTKIFKFRFNSDIGNTYILLFGHLYLRFIQDGGYVLEAAKNLTGVAVSTFTIVGHGFVNGDWIKPKDIGGLTNVNGRTLVIAGATANTFTLTDVFGNAIVPAGAYTAGGTFARVYTVVSPYASTDLADLRINQKGDDARFTHSLYPTYILTRLAALQWAFTAEVLAAKITAPANLTGASTPGGFAGFAWGVTAVDATGEESLISDIFLEVASVNFTVTAGSYKYGWDPVPGADHYNMYRSAVTRTGTEITRGAQLGYLGRADGAGFTDNNIIPDYTRTPPEHNDPFANGAVDTISLTNGGAGYTGASVITLTSGTGTGFVGRAIVDVASGKLIGVKIVNPGKNYKVTDTMAASIGAGATMTFTVTPDTGNYPALAASFQQRQLYAATLNQPLTVFGSKTGKQSNFDNSVIVSDSDSYEFDIDSEEITPIRHMIAVRGGLMLMTDANIFLLTGSGTNNPLTPTNALSDPQSYSGVSKVEPEKIDTDLLFCDDNGQVVRQMSYSEFSRIYSGTDVSILSNHLFGEGQNVIRWSYASAPHKLVWAVREDGESLSFCTVKEQNVYAWTHCATRGFYLDVVSVKENTLDSVYFIVKRLINGRWTKFIERQANRIVYDIEDMMCSDAALRLNPTYPAFTVSASAATGSAVVFAPSGGAFSGADIGKCLRMGGGKAYITAYSAPNLIGNVVVPITDLIPEDPDNRVISAVSGEWTLDTLVSVVSGLWHLEGEKVVALVDGSVVLDLVVTGGQVTLPNPGTRIIIGIPYRCIIHTLPLASSNGILEGKRKRVVAFAARVNDTRGLSSGPSLDQLYDMKERSDEPWAEPTRVINGVKYQLLAAEFDNEGQTYIVQDNPLPATLLGHVVSMDMGDDDS